MSERTARLPVSRLGTGAEAKGKLSGSGRFEVLGTLRGEIDWAGTLALAPGSVVEARGRAARLEVRGALSGKVEAEEAFVSREGSWTGGGVVAEIATEDGARVEGDFRFGAPASARETVGEPGAEPAG